MALSKEDRIAFSKKIVNGDLEKRGIEASRQTLETEKQKQFDLDQGNMRLVEFRTGYIDRYQVELGRYNGIFRTELTEQDIQDASRLVLGNFLYPNNPNLPPPSTAPQTWTKPKPYARNKAVGRLFTEMFPAAVPAEQTKLAFIIAKIAEIEAYPLIQRVTGQVCIPAGGTCSNPSFTTQATCELNGGIWTPTPDMIVTNAPLQSLYQELLDAVNDLRSYVLITQALIVDDDFVPARQAQNNAAIANVNTIVAAIDVWLALPAFNTGHGQTTCAGFNAYNPALLGPTRLQLGDLNTFESVILARQSFVALRVTQIDTNLGTIAQDLMTGNYTGSGLYFERWNFVGLRLNFYGGSLIAYNGIDNATTAQLQLQDQINLSIDTYKTLLDCSVLTAPTNGTNVIHLKSSVGFVAGDVGYIVSDSQEEIPIRISSVEGNRIKVGNTIPAKYRPGDSARVYKDRS